MILFLIFDHSVHTSSIFEPEEALKLCENVCSAYIFNHEATPKNRAISNLLFYDCFCSVDKNHHLQRRWINPFSQLLAFIL